MQGTEEQPSLSEANALCDTMKNNWPLKNNCQQANYTTNITAYFHPQED